MIHYIEENALQLFQMIYAYYIKLDSINTTTKIQVCLKSGIIIFLFYYRMYMIYHNITKNSYFDFQKKKIEAQVINFIL